MFWITFVIIFCAIFYYKITKTYSYWKNKHVKYVKPIFLFGNFNLFQPIDKTLKEWTNTYPSERYVGIYLFTTPALLIKDPELIKQITIKEFDSFTDHRSLNSDDKFFERNLALLTGNQWRDMRVTLSPSFTGNKMKIMFPLINECATNFVKHFESEALKHLVQELEMKDVCTRFANDVIASTAFGIQCDSLKNRNNEFYLMGKKATDMKGLNALKFILPTAFPRIAKLLKIKVVSNDVRDFFSGIIKQSVEAREKNGIVRPDMIHLLLEAQKLCLEEEESSVKNEQITVDDIVSQAFLFFFAGFDTVSTALSFVFYELAMNPNLQSRLRREIQAVEDEITYETLREMKYLDMFVSEVLRLWAPSIVTDRKATKSFRIQPVKSEEQPYDISVDDILFIPIFALHRDPKYYPDPERFDPERFSDENKHKIQPFTYLPFGVGPRNCIGSRFALLEIKALIFNVLKVFEIMTVDKSPIPMVLDKFALAPKNGMWLGFKKI